MDCNGIYLDYEGDKDGHSVYLYQGIAHLFNREEKESSTALVHRFGEVLLLEGFVRCLECESGPVDVILSVVGPEVNVLWENVPLPFQLNLVSLSLGETHGRFS